nr:MAG TPA: hypothetical protein [Bacteriophage sp.]
MELSGTVGIADFHGKAHPVLQNPPHGTHCW